MRALANRAYPFETLRGVTVFIVFAGVLAPFLSSFLDAAFVLLNAWGASDYLTVFRARFLANALAALTVVPLIVSWCHRPEEAAPSAPSGSIGEAAAMAGGLVPVGVLVFEYEGSATAVLPAILYLPLPFMPWAAFRFGPRGASAACAVVSFLAIFGAAHGRGPFAAGSVIEIALAVQLFLIFVAVFLLCLAAATAERNEAERALRASEDRYRAVIDSQTDLLCRYAPDTTITSQCGVSPFGQSPRADRPQVRRLRSGDGARDAARQHRALDPRASADRVRACNHLATAACAGSSGSTSRCSPTACRTGRRKASGAI